MTVRGRTDDGEGVQVGMARDRRLTAVEAYRLLVEDLRANRKNPKARVVLVSLRIASLFAVMRESRNPLWVLGLPCLIGHRLVIEWLLGVELPAKTRVGGGLRLYHGQGLVVHDHAVIGSGVVLRQNTSIGVKAEGAMGAPFLEDGVDVGANVCIIGSIRIGKYARIGAGSVVVHDVAPYAVVAGNPARPIGSCAQ